jgi:hypothetical protein
MGSSSDNKSDLSVPVSALSIDSPGPFTPLNGSPLLTELQQIDDMFHRIKEDYQGRNASGRHSDIDTEEWAVVVSVLSAARDKALRKRCVASLSLEEGAPGLRTAEIEGFLARAGAAFELRDVLKDRILASLGACG